MKQYKKSKNKFKKELKDLKKQNQMLYSIYKKSGLHRKLKNKGISSQRLPISAAILEVTLPAMNHIPIHPYPEIATKMKIESLLNIGREIYSII